MITCQEQTDLIDLSVQFGQLADRQNKSLKDAKHFARQTNGNKNNLNEGQVAQLVAQQADESALRDEVKARLDKLATLADQVDSATANQLSKVMTAIAPADLLSSLEDACVGLRQTNIFQAAVAEAGAGSIARDGPAGSPATDGGPDPQRLGGCGKESDRAAAGRDRGDDCRSADRLA